jgi:hypothetical protein
VIELNGPGFGRLPLTLSETIEGQHFYVPDVRAGAKSVATLAYEKQGYGVLIAAPYLQAGIAADAQGLFAPVRRGGVGRGRARAFPVKVTPHPFEGDWPTARPNRAPKGLSRRKAGSR